MPVLALPHRRKSVCFRVAGINIKISSYFTPFDGYQDGGLGGHNNPIHLALWEQDIIWSRRKKQPDCVVSLGTGFKQPSETRTSSSQTGSFLRTRSVPRLFRSFLNFFVGEIRWQELQNSLPPREKPRYHRFNVEFHDTEPDLDDLQELPGLQYRTEHESRSDEAVQRCADNLLASLFYVQIDEMPVLDQTLFVCKGKICCRLGPSSKALPELAYRLKDANFYLNFHEKIACMDDEMYQAIICDGKPYCRPIVFNVMSMEDSIDIKIEGLTARARSISNCPYKIQTLVEDEGVDCVFGHRKSKKRLRTTPQPSPKRLRLLN